MNPNKKTLKTIPYGCYIKAHHQGIHFQVSIKC